ncbi:unnamed protein product [Leptosia nina]|uniref:Uncharacterized protein n=1 Tax=Leptosia nina TaxID=320188 RepID=A0AAV1JV14_9NEOP
MIGEWKSEICNLGSLLQPQWLTVSQFGQVRFPSDVLGKHRWARDIHCALFDGTGGMYRLKNETRSGR